MKPDGFRGKAWEGAVVPQTYYAFPHLLQVLLGVDCLYIAKDPRPSSHLFYQVLIQGALDAGIQVHACGVMPTPMLAKWQHSHGGIVLMVTASHNPVGDNGLKMIGHRFSSEELLAIDSLSSFHAKTPGKLLNAALAVKHHYLDQLAPYALDQQQLVMIDHAHGAWAKHLDVFSKMGFSVNSVGLCQPERINETGCMGSDQWSGAKGLVVLVDGDGDRLNLVHDGVLLNGDDFLCHLATQPVCGTVMSNQGLAEALGKKGLVLHRAKVGDYHVARMLDKLSLQDGGEPCGHMIDLNWMRYSDPLYMLLRLLKQGIPKKIFQYPQKHLSLPRETDIKKIEAVLQGIPIRRVIRKSDTEPVLRVMLEGPLSQIEALAIKIDQALNSLSSA